MTLDLVEKLYKEYQTPAHVIAHCKKVAAMGHKIAGGYIKKGIVVDRENLKFACLLHDLLRIVDFNAGGKYAEMQKKLQTMYPDMDHSMAAYTLLNRMGEPVIAKIIKKHAFDGIMVKENHPFTLEEKIMTYADKRVLHQNIVSLKERFEDGKKRYNPNNENQEHDDETYKAYFALEEELLKCC
jgi:HD superfamily phosphodiesterase